MRHDGLAVNLANNIWYGKSGRYSDLLSTHVSTKHRCVAAIDVIGGGDSALFNDHIRFGRAVLERFEDVGCGL